MANLTYNYPYNRDIADRVLDAQVKNIDAWEPERLIGGGRTRLSTDVQPSYYANVDSNYKYVQPGVSTSYPMYNAVELKRVNEKSYYPSDVVPMQGGNISSILKKNEHELHQLLNYLDDDTKNTLSDIIKGSVNDKLEGGFSFNDFGKGLLSFGKQLLGPILDVAAPAIGTTLGTAVGNPMLGAVVADVGKNVLKSMTGAGKKAKKEKKVKGIGIYSGDDSEPKKDVKPKKGKKVKVNLITESINVMSGGKMKSDKMRKRNELVKKIMKEKNMKLGEASKYVKENKLM